MVPQLITMYKPIWAWYSDTNLIFSDERRLLDGEKVLFVQLNWGKDVREGRFLLKQEVRLFNTG
jgi:hypothetical protein